MVEVVVAAAYDWTEGGTFVCEPMIGIESRRLVERNMHNCHHLQTPPEALQRRKGKNKSTVTEMLHEEAAYVMVCAEYLFHPSLPLDQVETGSVVPASSEWVYHIHPPAALADSYLHHKRSRNLAEDAAVVKVVIHMRSSKAGAAAVVVPSYTQM